MKTDRELLELAAKAAGYTTAHKWNAKRMLLNPPVVALVVRCDGELVTTGWNPAADDGDSRRLQVKLRLQVTVGRLGCGVSGLSCPKDIYEEFQPGCDEMAVVRLAVLRAAAAIGEAMP